MNMKLSEWKKVIAYASEKVELPNFSYSEYVVGDCRGIYIYLLTDNGSIFERYATGVKESVEDYCSAIDLGIKRLTEECM